MHRASFAQRTLATAPAALLTAGALAAQPPAAPSSLAGSWRGTSLCTPVGKPACHDETVVYHLRRADGSDAAVERLSWTMNKIVAGQEEEMATLDCAYRAADGEASCPMRDWTWRFRARGDTLSGTLANSAGVVWRTIHVTRAAAPSGARPGVSPSPHER